MTNGRRLGRNRPLNWFSPDCQMIRCELAAGGQSDGRMYALPPQATYWLLKLTSPTGMRSRDQRTSTAVTAMIYGNYSRVVCLRVGVVAAALAVGLGACAGGASTREQDHARLAQASQPVSTQLTHA